MAVEGTQGSPKRDRTSSDFDSELFSPDIQNPDWFPLSKQRKLSNDDIKVLADMGVLRRSRRERKQTVFEPREQIPVLKLLDPVLTTLEEARKSTFRLPSLLLKEAQNTSPVSETASSARTTRSDEHEEDEEDEEDMSDMEEEEPLESTNVEPRVSIDDADSDTDSDTEFQLDS
eukprot:TRINITY_DN661_c0_g1_i1.p2 TRINITY_DN661_c0_g1~~TRINITY_DN661_c0_g1_i1.p2  ORF type:complete len:174 (-),score=39.11 TRINITY_DN661_c0_g1_i1:120-641(-)